MIDRVPGELWTEVHDTTGDRDQDNHQEKEMKKKKKKCKKGKWLSDEALQIAEKRREA